MALDERERLELRQALVETLGPEQGNRLMDHVPPFDWADVAMKQDLRDLELALKQDLVALEERLDHRFDLIDERFKMIDPMMDGKIGKLYTPLIGMMLAMASVTAAVVAVVVALLV